MHARPRSTSARTAHSGARVSLAAIAAACLLLFSQRPSAQGQRPAPPDRGRERVVEGTLEAYYEDSPSSARLEHVLNTGTERIPLRFEKNPPHHLLTGSRVRVTGTTQDDGTLMLSSNGGPSMTRYRIYLGLACEGSI